MHAVVDGVRHVGAVAEPEARRRAGCGGGVRRLVRVGRGGWGREARVKSDGLQLVCTNLKVRGSQVTNIGSWIGLAS